MSDTRIEGLVLTIQETCLLYARLKASEAELGSAERNLLNKLEGFLYGSLSIEELESLVGGRKVVRR